jgi:hypothetical protein
MLDKVLTPNDRKEALGVWSFFGLIENRHDGLTFTNQVFKIAIDIPHPT